MQGMISHIAMSLLVVLGSAGTVMADTLTVTGFSHPPNYALTTDLNDTQQLTDGRLASFPIWSKKESVGWAFTTPIAIELRLLSTGAAQNPKSGTLRLHSAKGLYAGVDVPRLADVYARSNDGKLRLVGSASPNSGNLKDKNVHWLDIEIQSTTESLLLVLHASGDYLFLDEIEWRASGPGRLPVNPSNLSSVRTVLEDSTRRAVGALEKAAASDLQAAAISLPIPALHIWSQDPWKEINLTDAPRLMTKRPSLIEIRGYSGEHESICLGIVGGNEAAINGLRAQVDGLSTQAVKLYEVKPVIASNGKRVYDPLVPLDENGTFSVRSGVPVYLWIDFDLAALGAGQHRFDVTFTSRGQVQKVPGVVSVNAYAGQGIERLHAVNWAYLSDKPVFHNKTAAVEDLVRHGIDTFVAHPAGIPGMTLDGSWPIDQDSNFSETVELAKRHGILLLYMGWSEAKNPLGFSTKAPILNSVAKERLLGWVKKMSAYLSERGLPPDRWAFYPVDEPNRDGLLLVRAVAQVIKEWNPAVRVYADPSVHASPPLETADLQDAQSLVDHWQPNLLAVRGRMGEFFKALKKDWWIYGNPKSPAKVGSPLRDYRMLAWWAWYYGARGVGFWSYSDTGGSSAWEDVDGRRPDWAVVYETSQGIVSSRRWEAFREGLEDYVLLSGANRPDVLRVFPSGEQDFDQWDITKVDDVRRALLDDL
ncbi:MAG: hypothetical protein QM706_08610 [Nitrospira sp.]